MKFQQKTPQNHKEKDTENVNHLSLNNLHVQIGDEIIPQKNEIEKSLTEISKHLEKVLENMHDQKYEKHTQTKWEFVATVLDRFFFMISLIFSIIITISTILTNKNFWRLT